MADVGGSVRVYGLIAAMWIRSTLVYRTSFAAAVLTNFLVTALDFVVIWMMFSQATSIGGYSFAETAFLYGTASVSFGITALLLGSVDDLGLRVRDGSSTRSWCAPPPCSYRWRRTASACVASAVSSRAPWSSAGR